MDLLAAIKREERKLERQLGKLQKQFNGLRAAAKALGDSTIREVTKLRSVCYPLLRKRRFQRQQSARGQNSEPRRTRRR